MWFYDDKPYKFSRPDFNTPTDPVGNGVALLVVVFVVVMITLMTWMYPEQLSPVWVTL